MFLFRRKKKDDEPVDLEARSPQTGTTMLMPFEWVLA